MEEENCSQKSKVTSKSKSLIDFVFSWSLEDVLNKDLYKNQVEKIPETFDSVRHYKESYVFPLLEETRAELSSSLELIFKAPFAEVLSVEESKPLQYRIQVDSWRNKFYNRAKEPYRTLHGDIFLISDVKPATVSDLQQLGRMWTLTWVSTWTENQKSLNGDDGSCLFLNFKASNQIEVNDGQKKSLYVVFLTNITTNYRIWNSLHLSGNDNIIKEVLCTNSMVEELCNQCSVYNNAICAERFLSKIPPVLNESQTTAVLCSLCKLYCTHKSSVELIWGPPGTGKTKTISMLLWAVTGMNYRIVACAPTNVAITGLASRVVKLVKESSEISSQRGELCSLGDMLLFGNKERLKVGSDLEDIYLDYRVDRLVECFGKLTGWKHHFTAMIDFLEGCVSQYHIFLENNSCKNGNKTNDQSCKEVKSFREFAKERFRSISLPLRRCVQILCTHTPKSFILEHNYPNMVLLFELLDSFESLLSCDGTDMKALFSCLEVVQNFPYSDMYNSTLPFMRMKFLSILKVLKDSLALLKLPNAINKHSMRKLCFGNASLFFCTVSSSCKLHSEVKEPFNLLVIDEAAQLKECESTIALQLPGLRHAILIGDEHQLPATVHSKVSDKAGYGRSIFERLSSMGHSKLLLNVQYRMQPSISCFPNSRFYLNQILDAPIVKSRSYLKYYLPGPMFGPYSFISVSGGREEVDDVGRSMKNLVEVAVVVKIVQNLYKAFRCSRQNLSIGVISPYAAQVVAIQEKLGRKYDNLDGFTVTVKSIDGFQGGEEDIIIISTVRSSRGGSIGFIANPQRTNVALTRARHCLWILGNGTALANSASIWEAVIHDAKIRQCFFNADEDKDLAKAIIEFKEEHVELDDLLHKGSILYKTSKWKVLVSENFGHSFGKLKSTQTKKSVIVFLLKLSTGWRPTERNGGLIPEIYSQFLFQFKVASLCIVWTIDIEKDSKFVQVLKVWDILPPEKVSVLVKCLESIFRMYTDDFFSYCKAKCLEGDLEIPMSWILSSDIVPYENHTVTKADGNTNAVALDGGNYFEDSNLEQNLFQVKFYSLSYRLVNHLLSDRDCRELDLPYQVTDQELEIILSHKSSFIVGRPSIGKITVMTLKLFQKEWQHYTASERFSDTKSKGIMDINRINKASKSIGKTKDTVLRQIFVTVSPKLCAAVKQRVSHLKSFTYGAKFSAERILIDMHHVDDISLSMDVPDNFVNIPPGAYPLVITFRKFLTMLDGTVGDSYFERFHDEREHFPGKTGSSSSFGLRSLIRRKEINYDRFSSYYWPHFNVRLTKKLDASTVFSEIIFCIKGGLSVGEACDVKLSREDYVLLPKGHVSTLSRKRREKIYDIFLDYESRKIDNGEFDLADLVSDLHRRLEKNRYEGQKMDFVYVDEVQGLTMREIALLKYICRNVHKGFVFSGHTAQIIGATNFKFQNIQSLFYKEFVSESRNGGDDEGTEKWQISEIFHLSQNFQIHAGVLNLAQSVIDLLFRFFPLSIDILCPETGDSSRIDGKLPVLIETGKDENAIITILGSEGNAGQSTVCFGAEQVILVRDDCAREEIAALVGKRTLVLSIMECKGLDFQDVFLYNFFGSSPFRSQWRIIYEYMKEQDMLDSASLTSFSSFNHATSSGFCLELKLLYTAVTRSRQRLWICENGKDFSNPICDYWKKLGLVQSMQLDKLLVQGMQVESSKEEWRSQGIKLYCEGRYELASMCFARAGDKYREKWALATSLWRAAECIRCSDPEMVHAYLSQAAEIFNNIGRDESAAQCYIELEEYQKAGAIYLKKCGDSRLEDAGDCFLLAGCHKLAAEAYAKGNYFSKCLSICTSRSLFDMGLQFIQSWRQHATLDTGMVERTHEMEKLVHNFLEKCAFSCHERQDHKSMMSFVKAFHSMDSKRLFMKTVNCFDELLVLEKESGNFMEAAAIAKLKGDLLLEVDLLEKGGHYKDASILILFYVLAKSLWVSGNQGWPLKPFKRKEKLLMKAKLLAMKDSAIFHDFVCTEVKILSSDANTLSKIRQYLSDSERQHNLGGVILCARKILDAHLRLPTSMYQWDDDLITDLMKHSEKIITQNQVSAETLAYFWSFWKKYIVIIIEYLGSRQTQDVNENLRFEEFCLNYFGIRKEIIDQNNIYLLLDSDAEWAIRIDKRLLQSKGGLVGMDAQQFFSAAKIYWCSEVLSVSMKVLGSLKALHGFSVKNSLPKFCQIKTAIHIVKITKFLMEFNFLESHMDEKTLQKFFDTGLQSTLFLKNANVDINGVGGSHKMDNFIHGFLVEGALHYHALEDKTAMLKYVRAFHTMDSKRSFLKTLDCSDELLLLEEESGNFVEAAMIANQKGDLLLEVDLLGKAGHYRDASKLILSYVLAKSLWTTENKGWPLKQFKHKEKLLRQAKTFAENDSDIFSEIVCTEANILSNQMTSLLEMKQNMDASERQKNLRGAILSAWKILDAHLHLKPSDYKWDDEVLTDPIRHSEEMFSQNQLSVETLVHFWNFWKEKILDIFQFLGCFKTQNANENNSCEEFCLSYFGVRKVFNIQNTMYTLLISDVDWVRKINEGSLKSSGKLVSVNIIEFVSVAQSYWCAGIVSVGMRVLEVLENLHMFSVSNSLPIWCQSMTALHFFEVTKFLMGSKFLELSCDTIVQKFFDMRLQFIQHCRRHVGTDACMLNKSQEIYDIEQFFLEKCALHYHELQNKTIMMKFVKSFHLKDSKRAFLRSLGCFDELLLLEEESGNFMEAACIARLKGDLLLEVDLLQKAGHYKDAAMLILSYTMANSLWAPGNKGWPLMQFAEKEGLLIKAKSFASKHSDIFYESFCTEINILLDQESTLPEMKEYFSASQRNNSINGEILSARKVLDAYLNSDISTFEWEDELAIDFMEHLEDRVFKNRVSVETLVYFWNVWKEKILNIFEYVGSPKAQGVTGYESYQKFCLDYFGVRQLFDDLNTVYLLNSSADWVRRIDDGSLQRSGKLVGLDIQQFIAAAQSYWHLEVYSVGMKVLECLTSLLMFSIRNSLSLVCQSMTAIHIFDISKFLMESEFLKTVPADRTLQNFLDLSTQHFFEIVFPLDWSRPMEENMMTLRGSELSRNVLKEFILKNVNSKSDLTYGKIGRVVMVMFGYGKLTSGFYEMIAKKFDVNPLWRPFFSKLRMYMSWSEFPEGLVARNIDEAPEESSLVLSLRDALRETYYADWREELDYISPNCFLYLVERYMILVSYFQGCFFTVKSSFMEWLICHEWDIRLSTSLVTDMVSSATDAFDFVACIAQQLLVNKCDALVWIKKSNLDLEYYPLLVLRLVVVLCLLCLNSGKYFVVLNNLLARTDISSELPLPFFEALQRRKKRNCTFRNALAAALAKIENPLVIVSLDDKCQKFSCPDAIIIGTEDIQCGKELLRVLFPENFNDSDDCVNDTEMKYMMNPCSVQLSLSRNSCEKNEKLPPLKNVVTASNNDLKIADNDEDGGLRKNYGPSQEASIKSVEDGKDGKKRLKVWLEKKIHKLNATATQSFCNSPGNGDAGNLYEEVNSTIPEQKELSTALDVSKQELELLLNDLIIESDRSTPGNASQTGIPSGSQEKTQLENIEAKKIVTRPRKIRRRLRFASRCTSIGS